MDLVTRHKLQPWTYYCLFGLLAVSGMRLGEALNLQPHDANWSESLLTISGAKFKKSRLVPLHPSTKEVLLAYAGRRDQIYAPRRLPYFFVSSHGTRLNGKNVSKIFRGLCRQIGIRDPGAAHGPRLHDFRQNALRSHGIAASRRRSFTDRDMAWTRIPRYNADLTGCEPRPERGNPSENAAVMTQGDFTGDKFLKVLEMAAPVASGVFGGWDGIFE